MSRVNPEVYSPLPVVRQTALGDPMPTVDHDCVDALPIGEHKQRCTLEDDLAFDEAMADDLVPPHELKLRKPWVAMSSDLIFAVCVLLVLVLIEAKRNA